MNRQLLEVFQLKLNNPQLTQRNLAKKMGWSLGKTNKLLEKLKELSLFNSDFSLTEKGKDYIKNHHPQKAVILAAGYGMRMVPINTEEPKGLLEVNGEPLIERLINQLHEIGVHEIHVVVGFMKEHYEYLIDQYDVKLIVNPHYVDYKNLYSLYLAKQCLEKSYIIPCDVWFKNNPFSSIEDQSWYLFSDQKVNNSNWQVTKQGVVRRTTRSNLGNRMVGIAYLNKPDADYLSRLLETSVNNDMLLGHFWEQLLNQDNKFILNGKLINDSRFSEINSYEQLRDLDFNSSHLQNNAMKVIEQTLKTDLRGIQKIRVLKKGMTNRSFLFVHDGQRYIMRIPGEGTGELINRQEESDVYQKLKGISWTERVLYLNPYNGYKLSAFINNARNSDATNWHEVNRCMTLLRKLHNSSLKVKHTFKLYDQINFYEKLRKSKSAYRDYSAVKAQVNRLKPFIKKYAKQRTLCHIDANPDNFVFDQNDHLYLIDWEYAGMQDPDVDVAMFAIYAMYDKQQIDKLIDIYYQQTCDQVTRYKIYAYIAVCGLLWSNWCEYKQLLGLDFGEYSLAQYRYAKNYSSLVLNSLEERNV